MKNILQLLSLGLLAVSLSSCDVGAGAYAGARPGYGNPHPRYYHNNNYSEGYYNPTYYPSRSRGINAGVNANVAPLNVRTSTGLGLF